jgi:D-alanyl-lipoteichoic acid acyltransferase DltB (MBOAT superfamily)
VYIPLGGSRVSKAKVVRNTFIIFLVSGFWHGANWTFIAWGAYHAVLFLPLILTGKNRKYTNQVAEGRILPTWKEVGQLFLTFFLVVVGWIIFRSTGMPSTFGYFKGLLHFETIRASYQFFTMSEMWPTNLFIVIMLVVEWLQRGKEHGLDLRIIKQVWVRALIYYTIVFMFIIASGKSSTFIYFQF